MSDRGLEMLILAKLELVNRKLDKLMSHTHVGANDPRKTGCDQLHLGQVSFDWYLCNDNDCWCGGQMKIDAFERAKAKRELAKSDGAPNK
jgi:hypothetical protein